MASPIGAGDFIALATLASKCHNVIIESRPNFNKLNLDIECFLVNITCLDDGPTRQLIDDYKRSDGTASENRDGVKHREVTALRDGLVDVVRPFYQIFEETKSSFASNTSKGIGESGHPKGEIYLYGPTTAPLRPLRSDKAWRIWEDWKWSRRIEAAFKLKTSSLNELRTRLAVQIGNLNLFMTRLTHVQLRTQMELMTLNWADMSLVSSKRRYDGQPLSATVRNDVALYINYLLSGGVALDEGELKRRAERPIIFVQAREREERNKKGSRRHDSISRSESRSRSRSRTRLRGPDIPDAEIARNMQIEVEETRRRLALIEWQEENTTNTANPYQNSMPPPPLTPIQTSIPQSPRPSLHSTQSSTSRSQQQPMYTNFSNNNSGPVVCDDCGAQDIRSPYYICSTGKCAARGEPSYDLCEKCYRNERRCPGRFEGRCGKMRRQ